MKRATMNDNSPPTDHARRIKREIEYLASLEEEFSHAHRAAIAGDHEASLERSVLTDEIAAQKSALAKLQSAGAIR
jgi:hypothetical protein